MEVGPEVDDRIIPIRCTSCHKLRPYPISYDEGNCPCGGIMFETTNIMPDEEQEALLVYYRQIEERNLWKRVSGDSVRSR